MTTDWKGHAPTSTFTSLTPNQLRIATALFIGYALFSSLRRPLSSAWSLIKEDFRIENSSYGIIVSNYTLAFGISKCVGGILSDRISSKYLFTGTLLLAAATNFAISFTSNSDVLGSLWVVNGLCQGVAWPCIAKLIVDCYPGAVLGTMWSVLTSAQSVGAILAPPLILLILPLGWRVVFMVISLIGAAGAAAAFALLQSSELVALRDRALTPSGNSSSTAAGGGRVDFGTVVVSDTNGLEVASNPDAAAGCSTEEPQLRRSNRYSTPPPLRRDTAAVEFGTPMLFKKRLRSRQNGSQVEEGRQRHRHLDSGDAQALGEVAKEGCDDIHVGRSARDRSVSEVEEGKVGDQKGAGNVTKTAKMETVQQVILSTLLFNTDVQLICLAAMFAYFALAMMVDWFNVYLTDGHFISIQQATELMVWLEIGSLVGAFACGIMSDLMQGRRTATAVIFTLAALPLLVLFPSPQLRALGQYSRYGTVDPMYGARGMKITNSGAFSADSTVEADRSAHPHHDALSSLLHDSTVAMHEEEFVPYVFVPEAGVNSLSQLHLTYLGIPISASEVFILARFIIFLCGFAINGPKTLLGMSIRDVSPAVIVGSVGGILGLVGQCGAYIGSVLLSAFLKHHTANTASNDDTSTKSDGPITTHFTLLSVLPTSIGSFILSAISAPNDDGANAAPVTAVPVDPVAIIPDEPAIAGMSETSNSSNGGWIVNNASESYDAYLMNVSEHDVNVTYLSEIHERLSGTVNSTGRLLIDAAQELSNLTSTIANVSKFESSAVEADFESNSSSEAPVEETMAATHAASGAEVDDFVESNLRMGSYFDDDDANRINIASINGWLYDILTARWTGWDIFPLVYTICALATIIILLFPAYKEHRRITEAEEGEREKAAGNRPTAAGMSDVKEKRA